MKQRENSLFACYAQRDAAAGQKANAAEHSRKQDTLTWNPPSLAEKG